MGYLGIGDRRGLGYLGAGASAAGLAGGCSFLGLQALTVNPTRRLVHHSTAVRGAVVNDMTYSFVVGHRDCECQIRPLVYHYRHEAGSKKL